MEPCSTTIGLAIAGVGAIAGLFTAGAQAASTASQVRGTATERDKYRQKSETVENELVQTKKKLEKAEEDSRKKEMLALGLMILLGVAYNELLEAQRTIAEQDAELARLRAERDRSRKMVNNIRWYGVPAVVVVLLVLVFFATKQHYGRHSVPASRDHVAQNVIAGELAR